MILQINDSATVAPVAHSMPASKSLTPEAGVCSSKSQSKDAQDLQRQLQSEQILVLVIQGIDALLFQFGQSVFHRLHLLCGMPLPQRNFTDHPERLR